jgi:hypothetical protein
MHGVALREGRATPAPVLWIQHGSAARAQDAGADVE